jgi:hypothetical protein
MPLSTTRANLIIVGVVLVAIVGYAGFVRAKWNRMQDRGGLKSLTGNAGVQSNAESRGNHFASRVPDWVPLYPGTKPERISSSQAGIEHYFDVQLRTPDHCTKVGDWYAQKFRAAGYTLHGRFDYEDPTCNSTVQLDGPNFSRSISIQASGTSNGVIINLRAVERQVNGGATPQIPKWVPMYPGAEQPAHIDASTEPNGEAHCGFSFTSHDDAAKVYSWYQTELKKLGFVVNFEARPEHAGKFDSENRRDHRVLNMHNSPGPENTFIVDVIER